MDEAARAFSSLTRAVKCRSIRRVVGETTDAAHSRVNASTGIASLGPLGGGGGGLVNTGRGSGRSFKRSFANILIEFKFPPPIPLSELTFKEGGGKKFADAHEYLQ